MYALWTIREFIDHARTSAESRPNLLRLHEKSFTRAQLDQVRATLGQETVGIARIAKETGLTRQTIYRIKDDPAGSEASLAAWGL